MGGRGGSSGGPGGNNTDDPKKQSESPSDSLRKKIDKEKDEEEKEKLIVKWIEENESEGTETIINSTTGLEYECYSITIDGITILYQAADDAAFAAIKSLISGNKVPDRLKEHIDTIMIIPDQFPNKPEAIAGEKDGIITIFENRIVDAGILGHEASHALAEDIWGTHIPPANSDYMAAINSGEPSVSEYAKTGPGEDFAEAVRMYVENRKEFKKRWPKRYAVIHRMMRYRNYEG